jgi:hypothetical protein
MTEAPSKVDEKQLDELEIKVKEWWYDSKAKRNIWFIWW